MKLVSRCLASVVLLALLASPAAAQRKRDRSFQWYWGGQGGAFSYRTLQQSFTYDPVAGGHWLITANRTALYFAYEQAWFLTDATTVITDPASLGTPTIPPGFRQVTFGNMRRLMMGVLAFPLQKRIEPYVGGGFALMQVLDPAVDCSTCVTLSELIEAQDRAEDAASKAFFWVMGGLQISQGRLALFGQYLATSASQRFLIDGNTHSLQGGLRFSLGTSKEGITERN